MKDYWEDLEYFKKKEGEGEFKLRMIEYYYPIIYFGGNDKSFKYILFVNNTWSGGTRIAELRESGTTVSIIFWFSNPNYDFIYNNYDLKQNLKKLKYYLDNTLKYNPRVNQLQYSLDRLLTEITPTEKKNETNFL